VQCSYLGKSSGKGGLELWTHNLKSREVIEEYSSEYYNGPALKLGAGVQGHEAYEIAERYGYRVVGGSCPTVGIAGGYSQGGGHSALSSIHGLSADNILEWEIVTSDGEHLLATPSKNQDLYWALSGGGGGTYAVVLSMTTRLHPDGPISGAYLRFNDQDVGNDVYWDAINAFHSYMADFATDGVTALYSIYNNSFNLFSVSAPNKTTYEVVSRFEPILAALDERGINFSFDAYTSPTFFDHYVRDFGPLPNGYFSAGQLTSSRLVPRDVLGDPDKNEAMTKAFRQTAQNGDFFIACQALDVSNKSRSVAPNAVLPAWRDAATHCIVVGLWDYSLPRDVMEARQKRIEDEINPILIAATPGSGTYLNEANFRQADFQEHFFGDNYDKLLAVKKKYDPDDVFYVTTGVGSDAFVVDDSGRLCRA